MSCEHDNEEHWFAAHVHREDDESLILMSRKWHNDHDPSADRFAGTLEIRV